MKLNDYFPLKRCTICGKTIYTPRVWHPTKGKVWHGGGEKDPLQYRTCTCAIKPREKERKGEKT